jgi:hypothetical protein
LSFLFGWERWLGDLGRDWIMTFSSKKLGVKRSYPGIVEADETGDPWQFKNVLVR